MLSDLPVPSDPRVLVDYRNADDAGVFVVGDMALVQTVDFFTPIVDDPFAYGRIAAANAVSDVYAMGGRPITALAIAAFPAKDFAVEIVKAIFAGGLSVLQECGVALLGGHTVQDLEVKFGYAVTGLVAPAAVWTNAGARAGDVLIVTKALGTGVIATAAKFGRTDADVLAGAMTSMQGTNRVAAEVLRGLPGVVHGCTDVTGFGLVGHASEMATASGVAFEIDAAALPVLPGARDLALGNRTGGLVNNRAHFGAVVDAGTVPPDLLALAFDPQTSGGLLASVDAASAETILAALGDAGVTAARVGRVVPATLPTRVFLR
ncbi:Selenide, water dikinase [Luteitalea pratensis]|uniref:Selenide, water dikinase n=1 Tax=Luteitalea pratensis TaxID=1855912 RepID=A0A143PXE4_LUTPR|nr:Selenide, water dikinase [Luteitalea pratensis]